MPPFEARPHKASRRAPTRRRFGARADEAELSARSVIGMAHVAVGALGLLTGTFGGLFAAAGVAPETLMLAGGTILAAALTILAGLWIIDGRGRGAALAVVVDTLRLFLLGAAVRGVNMDVLLAAALLGAVLWLWPSLDARVREPKART